MTKEKFFWADAIADKIIKVKGKAPKGVLLSTESQRDDPKGPKKDLSERGKTTYVCASGITPSGTVHIGNFREIITTDLVVRALKDKGKKVRFIYSWDDFDRFRKVPANIPKEFEKYIGMPVSNVPSPFGKGSYAEYFEKEFEESLERVGIKPEFIRQSIMNKKCKYASLIKIALNKREEIIEILNKYRKEPLKKDWYPFAVYCEKCKKDFTKIINVEGYEIEYQCDCGFKNKIDYRKKVIVSVKWRVDWPMRWKYEKVDFEPGGADHSAPGGSFDTSKQIVKKVFDYEAPMYQLYEWIRIKGGIEFSSSSGNALRLKDVEEIYEPEVLRYLFVGTRPNKGFQISFDNDVIKIYEDYDELERKYYNKKANPQEKRIYELSQIETKKKNTTKTSFRHLITIVQSGKINELNKESKIRAEKVKNWLEKYAGEDMKFNVQKKINVKLNKKEKEALILLREYLALKRVPSSTKKKGLNEEGKKELTEKELFNEFYEICKEVDISNKEFFSVAYRVIINKQKGPRLAVLILDIGKDKIIKLLEQIK